MKKYGVFAAVAIAAAIFAVFDMQQSTNSPATGAEETAASALHSGVLLDNFDRTVRPQDDFYSFVNGGWMARTEIPADKARYGLFIALADKARDEVHAIIQQATEHADDDNSRKLGDFYRSYMNTDAVETRGLAPLHELFTTIDAINDRETLIAWFAQASRQGTETPLTTYIDADSKQPDRYTVYFYQSGLGLPDRDYYLVDNDNFTTIRAQYRAHIIKQLGLAGIDNAEAAASAIIALETRMAQAHWARVELRDRDKTYNPYDVAGLQTLAPQWAWSRYLQDSDIAAQPQFIVSAPTWLGQLSTLVAEIPLDDWKLYAKWSALRSHASALTAAIEDEDFAFYGKTLNGIEQQKPRWERAVASANETLGDIIGERYVATHFPPQAKQRMSELVENLRKAYHHSILELDWMSAETQQKAIEKLQKFTPKIGYPDKWRDYSTLAISADDLFGNLLRAYEHQHQYAVNKLGKPVDRGEWFMSPQTVNAYYNPDMNEIVFPAAILQPPFFDMNADDAINYGAIGGVIGHEMGHGFDDQGAKSDGDGVLRNWWTDSDKAEFKARTAQLADQYGAFKVFDDLSVNGELTLGENIGDLGGVTIALKAYQLSHKNPPVLDGFSGEQRLFIGWAQVWASKYREQTLRVMIATDPHSPPEFRVNGVLPNMPGFYQAFDVKETDRMYLPPEQRVKIW